METYRVAILGCRSRGTASGQAYHAHPRTEVVGICDLESERRDTLGNLLGISARYADLDVMIKETSPDIVAVPTGTEFHYDLCMRVLDHGCINIDVEKPICAELAQADALLKKAKKVGARISVHHQGRSGAALKAVSNALEAGKIGDLRHISVSGKGYYGGYGLMNIGTHTINAMLELTGHCHRVTASLMTDGRQPVPDDVVPSPNGMGTIAGEHMTAILEFGKSVTVTLTQHRFPVVDPTAHSFEVFGSEGRLFWHSSGAWWLPVPHFIPDNSEWQALKLEAPPDYDSTFKAKEDEYLYVDDYVQALDGDMDPPSNGAEGLHVMEIMMGIFESGAYGRPVSLPQEHRDHPLLRWRKELGIKEPGEMPRPYGDWLVAEGNRLGWDSSRTGYRASQV